MPGWGGARFDKAGPHGDKLYEVCGGDLVKAVIDGRFHAVRFLKFSM